jgi:Fe-S cluster biogenesis protein NfuA
VLRRATRRGSDVADRIRAALAELHPLLRIEAAGIELVSFDGERGLALLRVEGDCPDCEMSVAMMMEGIGAHLRARVPEIREVRRLGA